MITERFRIGIILFGATVMAAAVGAAEVQLEPKRLPAETVKQVQGCFIHVADNPKRIASATDDPRFGILIGRFQGKLFADRNGDGALTAADGPALGPETVLKAPALIGGKKTEVTLIVHFVFESEAVYLSNSTALHGRLNGRDVWLIDGSGSLDYTAPGLSSMIWGDLPPQKLSKYISIDGKLHSIHISPSLKLSTEKVDGKVARIRFDLTNGVDRVTLSLSNSDIGVFSQIAYPGTTFLPGEYTVDSGLIVLGEGPSSDKCHLVTAQSQEKPWTLKLEGGENRIPVGPPFRLEFAASHAEGDSRQIKVESVSLVGRGGDGYRPQFIKTTGSLECVVKRGDKEEILSRMEYG